MRGFGHELAGLLTVFAVPVALVCCFPYETLTFVPRKVVPSRESAAFVRLTPTHEREAIRVAKGIAQDSYRGLQALHYDLIGTLPDEPMRPLAAEVKSPEAVWALVKYPYPAAPRSLAAPALGPIPIGETAKAPDATPRFTKEELLKMD